MSRPSGLLPSGFVDSLAPRASQERMLRQSVIESFRRFGYQEVSPPLLEFEESLLDGSRALDRQTFRVLDAKSKRMMGIRADMTPQIARIAAYRMHKQPLPLRLCYAGTCLRVKGDGLKKSRQVIQAGIECIGANEAVQRPLVEVIRCAVEALEVVGMTDISLDITLPELATALLKELPAEKRTLIHRSIEQKDRHSIQKLDHPNAMLLLELLDGASLEKLRKLKDRLPKEMNLWLERVEAIATAIPNLTLTLDPLEESGFGYYEGIGFSIFSCSLGVEIGRGGCYRAHNDLPAYGFTLYLSSLLESAPKETPIPRCLVLPDASEKVAKDLRKKGWHTVYGTARSAAEASIEAKEQSCQHVLEKEEVIDV